MKTRSFLIGLYWRKIYATVCLRKQLEHRVQILNAVGRKGSVFRMDFYVTKFRLTVGVVIGILAYATNT
ncbi:hypothetical protein C5167_000213 [Papaver somniferum]|uniref:Uncharacterized protein n=1 Tax=Papaver somniferum TaxID=3469 RepID=A0A4Y7KRZ3_PAPSO|nr:hypothetical protein C5167_000213 [Papaver somniferum]